MEVIDIGFNDLDSVSMNFNDSDAKPSVNFGPGIELLMNDKKKSSSSNVHIDLGELDQLENELNELSGASSSNTTAPKNDSFFGGDTKTLSGFASGLFNFGGKSKPEPSKNDNEKSDSHLGHATAESVGNTKTWDGFSKMNEVPLSGSAAPKLTDREKRRKKRAMIKKLEEWHDKGLVKHSSHFNMDSVYEEVEDEYETALEDKRKKDSVKLQGWWFMTFINSIEYGNTIFNPFDLNLDGWGEQISEDIDSYEEIFSELHDKYKGGKLSPEISLLLRVGFSAAVVNITNKALSTATPGFNDVIRQNPELMKMFTSATVQTMGQQNSGMSSAANLVSGIMGANNPLNSMFGPPPAPVETKGQPAPARPGMNYTQHPGNRPDISAGRGAMFREQGVDLNDRDNITRSVPAPSMQSNHAPQARPEMRGPQNADINNILAGLKTRDTRPADNISYNLDSSSIRPDENDSMISISSLKDMQNMNMPKRTNKRKQRSDKNIVSLDI